MQKERLEEEKEFSFKSLFVPFTISLFSINFLLFIFFLVTNSYPLLAVLINIISILVLWFWIASTTTTSIRLLGALDGIVITCLFLFAFTLYFYNIDVVTPGIQGDEIAIAKASEQILSSSQFFPFVNVNLGHPTPLLYLTGLSIEVFGRSLMAIRLPYVIFGALSIAAFYLLLRLFFNRTISIAGSLLMLFSYPFVIVSRLAYEVTPEIFFQIVTIIFLYFVWKTKDARYYAAIGLTLGMGLYTYLGFRTFAVVVLMLTSYLIFKTSKLRSTQIKLFLITAVSLFIALVPLFSYSITHSNEVTERMISLSPLNQGYSSTEILKELVANVGRLSHLFFMGDSNTNTNGDTNYTRNPSNVSMFDFGTFIFFIVGLFYLFKTNKNFFIIVLILAISPLVNDIFVIEKIPEALHPYGVGHPNTLRIAGIIPILYFSIAYGLSRLQLSLKSPGIGVVFILLGFIILYNWHLYFQQPTNTFYGQYITNNNGPLVMNIVNLINRSNVTEVGVSPEILSDERFTYFLKKGINVKKFDPQNYNDAIRDAQKNQLSILYALHNTQLAIEVLTQPQPIGVQINYLSASPSDPEHSVYAVEFINTR